jgi:ABC-type nickel/cobalt efflux system permease component RcnA
MTRGQANVIRAFSIWTVYVWVTRMWNITRDDQSFGFKAVHSVLAIISIAFAIAAWVVVSRLRRRELARAAEQPEAVSADR